MPLNVMVLESENGVADKVADELTAAGHVVLRCHEEGAPAFPCVGVADQSACPLHAQTIDVALTVRSRPRSQPAPHEDGVRCAIMHRVPLVVAGPAVLDPFDDYATRVVDRTDDVVSAIEEVAAGELPQHTRIATEAVRTSRSDPEALSGASVSVTRRQGCLLVSIRGLDVLAARQRDAAIVRVLAKLREFDSSAKKIDVVLAAP